VILAGAYKTVSEYSFKTGYKDEGEMEYKEN
jgi:hypothetical protein